MTKPDKDHVNERPSEPERLDPVDLTADEAEEAGVEDAASKAADEKRADAEEQRRADEAEADALIAEAEAAVAGSAPSELATDEAVAAAKAEAKDWQEKFMRLHAEWDTYRRRTNEQREAEKIRAAENLVSGLIPVLDDFERTIAYATENGETGLLGGVKAVYSKLVDVLKKDGVEVIDPAGEAYDALCAQVVATVEDPSVPDETVAEVYQKGYRLGVKVLRPAMVTVSTGGPKRPKEEA